MVDLLGISGRKDRRRQVAESAMRPVLIVVLSVLLYKYFCLQKRRKQLPVQQLIPQLSIEALLLQQIAGFCERERKDSRGRTSLEGKAAEIAPGETEEESALVVLGRGPQPFSCQAAERKRKAGAA